MEKWSIAFSDIQGVTIEIYSRAFRIVLKTAVGNVAFSRGFYNDYTTFKKATRIHQWLEKNGVNVPLEELGLNDPFEMWKSMLKEHNDNK